MCDDWAVYQELFKLFMYFDMFYIQWHHLAKKDLWNKIYLNERRPQKFQDRMEAALPEFIPFLISS
jgi:hypothetical protein